MGLFTGKSTPSNCGACGREATSERPLTTVKVSDRKVRVHKDHTTDPKSGLFGSARRGRRS